MRKTIAVAFLLVLLSFRYASAIKPEYTGMWRSMKRGEDRKIRELILILKPNVQSGKIDIYRQEKAQEIYICTVEMTDQTHFKGSGIEKGKGYECEHEVKGYFENNRLYVSDKTIRTYKDVLHGTSMTVDQNEYKFKRWDPVAKIYPDFPKDNMDVVTD